ncbi:MAG: hypothetical protein OXC01_18570 [Immundisolibacterales bacterium]|nr:hypothetical protein [Immundisolibacterales bacterium]
MKSDEHKDLVNAVLASRDEIDPELETAVLEAIVDAEFNSAGDGDAAMHAINAALTAAIDRGVGYVHGASSSEGPDDNVGGDGEDLEDGP